MLEERSVTDRLDLECDEIPLLGGCRTCQIGLDFSVKINNYLITLLTFCSYVIKFSLNN